MVLPCGSAKGAEIWKPILTAHVNGLEINGAILASCDLASRKDVDGEIYRDRAGMEEIQRPQVQRAAR